MSFFVCAFCGFSANADDGCDETPGGQLVCVDCVDDEPDVFTPAQTNKGEG